MEGSSANCNLPFELALFYEFSLYDFEDAVAYVAAQQNWHGHS